MLFPQQSCIPNFNSTNLIPFYVTTRNSDNTLCSSSDSFQSWHTTVSHVGRSESLGPHSFKAQHKHCIYVCGIRGSYTAVSRILYIVVRCISRWQKREKNPRLLIQRNLNTFTVYCQTGSLSYSSYYYYYHTLVIFTGCPAESLVLIQKQYLPHRKIQEVSDLHILLNRIRIDSVHMFRTVKGWITVLVPDNEIW